MERIQDRARRCEAFNVADTGDGLKTVKLSPWGRVESVHGEFIVDEEGTAQVIAAFAKHGAALPVDREHESFVGRQPAAGSRGAVGWVEKVYAEPGVGLFALVKWTREGRQLILDDKFRYVSPVFFIEEETKRVVALDSVAITVKPAIVQDGTMRLAANADHATAEQKMGELRVALENRGVKLSDASDFVEILNAALAIVQGKEADKVVTNTANDAERAIALAVRKTLALSDAAGVQEVALALAGVCATALRDTDRKVKLQEFLAPWVAKGVLDPHSKFEGVRDVYAQFLALAETNPELCTTLLRERISQWPPSGQTTPPKHPGSAAMAHSAGERRAIIGRACHEFDSDPAHAKVTTKQAFVQLALHDAGLPMLHADEQSLVK